MTVDVDAPICAQCKHRRKGSTGDPDFWECAAHVTQGRIDYVRGRRVDTRDRCATVNGRGQCTRFVQRGWRGWFKRKQAQPVHPSAGQLSEPQS